MKSFDTEMMHIRNELLSLKTYLTKKTSVFRTEEYSITLPIQIDKIAPDIASGIALKIYKTENGSTALTSLSVAKDFLDGIYKVSAHFLPNDQKDSYRLYVYISTTNQQIIDRLNNGETIIVNVPVYITTTGTFEGIQ